MTKAALITLILAIGPAVSAQGVVRQGTAQDQSNYLFKSPMVLEVPLSQLRGMDTWRGATTKEYAKYICEDTSLTELRVFTGTKSSGKITKVTFEGVVFVRPSHDRLVNLRFILIKNGTELPQFAELTISAKEKKSREGYTKLEVPSADWQEMLQEGSKSFVRIVMSVKED